MRSRFFLLATILLFAGCSKKFSYHDAYKFDRHKNAVRDQEVPLTFQAGNNGVQFTASVGPSPVVEPTTATPTKKPRRLSAILANSMAEQIRHRADTTTKPATTLATVPNPALNSSAVAGFIITLGSVLLLPISFWFLLPLLLGIALSAKGLKSEKRKLALVAIWGTAIYLFLILLAALVISAGGGLDI